MYVRDNQFEFEEASVYGLSGEEYLDKYRMALRWMNDYEALKRVKVNGEILIVPIICSKPGLKQDPISYKIYINEKLVKNSSIDSDNIIIYSRFNLSKMGYKMGSFVEIKFVIDELWTPSEYGINDDRVIGIGIGNISFE